MPKAAWRRKIRATKKIGGIQLSLSAFMDSLWPDTFPRDRVAWGIRVALVWGELLRPVAKPFSGKNPWKEEHWFVLRIPFVIGPFVGAMFAGRGFYLGLKPYGIDATDTHYLSWLDRLPPEGETWRLLCPSARVVMHR